MTGTRVVAVDAERPEPAAIADAANIVRQGGLVAFPTETVYGLGAHALDAGAVRRIFAAKERPPTDPLIVHLAHARQLGEVASEVPDTARRLAGAFWPGPLTLVVRKTAAVPDAVTAGLQTVAVRVPSHRVARALMEACGVPVAAPSANRFSRPSPTRAEHVLADLNGRVDLILDAGPTPVGVESSIVDCTAAPPVLLRHGGLPIEALRVHVPDLAERFHAAGDDVPQPAPGQMLRHYAPVAPLTLFEGEARAVCARLVAETRTRTARGERVGILAPEEDVLALAPDLAALAAGGRVSLRAYGRRAAPETAAAALFDALRALDAERPDAILAAGIEPEGIGAAIRDRLTRAAEGRVVSTGRR